MIERKQASGKMYYSPADGDLEGFTKLLVLWAAEDKIAISMSDLRRFAQIYTVKHGRARTRGEWAQRLRDYAALSADFHDLRNDETE